MIALGSLQLGAFGAPVLDRVERVVLGALTGPLRLWYASDLHLRAGVAAAVHETLLASVRRHRPDAILLGGDLVDRPSGLDPLRRLVGELAASAPVLAVAGNHEAWVGRERVAASVRASGGRFGEPMDLAGGQVQLCARVEGAASDGAARVLVAHDPAVFPAAVRHGFELVLAGHLHGGQVHLFERGGRSYPGAWFYRWNGPRFESGASTLLVGRGIVDTLPLRYRCPREVLICDLVPDAAGRRPARQSAETDPSEPGRRDG